MVEGSGDKPLKINQIVQKCPELNEFLGSSGYAKCAHCGLVKRIFWSVKTTNPATKGWQSIPLICNTCIGQVNKILPQLEKPKEVKQKFVDNGQKTRIEFDRVNALKKFLRRK